MITIAQTAQFLLALDPQRNQARMAFYHFLKNFIPLDAPLNQNIVDDFYDRALSMQFWQANKAMLGETIKEDFKTLASRNNLSFDHNLILHAHEIQVITLEQDRDFNALLNLEAARYEGRGMRVKKFRISTDKASGPSEVLFVVLHKNGSVTVEIRQNTALLLNGKLQLVRPQSRLVYNSNLEFEPNETQVLGTSLMRTAVFKATDGLKQTLRGNFIQGTSLHRAEAFERSLEDVPELFQSIKKIERFYINPVTDPYYHKLMENFEKRGQ